MASALFDVAALDGYAQFGKLEREAQ